MIPNFNRWGIWRQNRWDALSSRGKRQNRSQASGSWFNALSLCHIFQVWGHFMMSVVSTIRNSEEARGHRGASPLNVMAQCCRYPQGPWFNGPWSLVQCASYPVPSASATAAAAFHSSPTVLPALRVFFLGFFSAILKSDHQHRIQLSGPLYFPKREFKAFLCGLHPWHVKVICSLLSVWELWVLLPVLKALSSFVHHTGVTPRQGQTCFVVGEMTAFRKCFHNCRAGRTIKPIPQRGSIQGASRSQMEWIICKGCG